MVKKKLVVAATALALAGLALPVAFAAEADWSMDGDCGACHVREAASCEAGAVAAGEAVGAAGSGDAVADADKVPAGKAAAGVGEASDDASATSGGKVPGNATATSGDEAGKTAVEDATPLASAHAALDCAACHNDEEALAGVHDGVTADDRMPKRLRKAKIDPEQLCQPCHGTLEELAQKTAESTALVDSAGTVVNPHDLPDVEDHAKLDCLDCHSMHKDQSSADTAMNACNGCHHAGVFECGTCH